MSMEITVTTINYRVDLTKDEYRKIEREDAERQNTEDKPCLYEIIDEFDGVDNTDYSGHFGPSVYFRIEAIHDTEELRRKITDTIKEYIS